MKPVDQAAKAFIEAKEAVEAAEAIKARAESALKAAYSAAGVEMTVVDGVKVSVSQSSRTSYDVSALESLVKPAIFKKVTVAAIDSKKLKAAVLTDLITEEVMETISKTTEFTRILVVALNAEVKSVDRKTNAA